MIVYSQTVNSSPELPEIKGYKPQFRYEEPVEDEQQQVQQPIIIQVTQEPTQEVVEETKQEEAETPKIQTTGKSKRYSDRNQFLSDMTTAYTKALKLKGINPEYAKYLAIQDALESNFGKNYAGNWNFGNITVGSSGASYTEGRDHDGYGNPIINKFRNYNSLDDYVNNKIALLSGKRYRAFNGDLSGFYARVKAGGYAGDPKYVASLTKLYNQYYPVQAKFGLKLPKVLYAQEGISLNDNIFNRYNFNNLYDNSAEDIVALQRALNVKDDGYIGDNTIKALQTKIGVVPTGKWNNNSIQAANIYVSNLKQNNNTQLKRKSKRNAYTPWTPNATEGSVQNGKAFYYDKEKKQWLPSSMCAQWANDALRQYKDANGKTLYTVHEIGGDAWTRLSSGKNAKMIYSGYEGLDYDPNSYSEYESNIRNHTAADSVKNNFNFDTLDKNNTYMVNMYYDASPVKKEAWERAINGTTGTHTGNLYWNQDTNSWHVAHNIHSKIYDDDVNVILGGKNKKGYGITAIAEAPRANSKSRIIQTAINAIHKLGIKKQGGYIIKGQNGLVTGASITNNYTIKNNGDYDYNDVNPEGYDLRDIGIYRTGKDQSTYANSDSLPIAHSLHYINDRLDELAERYNLSISEAKQLMGDAQAVMWNESGGASRKHVDPRTNNIVNSTNYNRQDNNPLYMTGVRIVNKLLGRGTSEGYGRVKIEDLRSLPYYNKTTESELNTYPKRTPYFSGLSTFASMAQRYHKLNDIFKDHPDLIYNENGTLSDLGHALLHISHNQGFENIEKNYNKYKENGDINELNQYLKFNYPSKTLQIIHGHDIKGSVPEELTPAIITANRK